MLKGGKVKYKVKGLKIEEILTFPPYLSTIGVFLPSAETLLCLDFLIF